MFLKGRFFLAMVVIIFTFILSFSFPELFNIAFAAIGLLLVLVLVDILFLFGQRNKIKAERQVPQVLNLGDETIIHIRIQSELSISCSVEVIDETPYQLQLRNLLLKTELAPDEKVVLDYSIRPTERGKYQFGDIQIFASGFLGFIQRRFTVKAGRDIAVYPSVLQMRQFELKVFSKMNLTEGIKKVRRLGHSTEFEQIKTYVVGDDYRNVNWKATSRKTELMVNQYEDEKAQQIYCIIDKSRSMRMPFNNMTLLDYAINSSLVISNIAMKKSDRAGLITFSDKMGTRLPAERSTSQLKKIQDALYKQKTKFKEANFEMLYFGTRNLIKGRSLLLLFTNFESAYSLQRALPLLRRINSQHLLVVVFFKNNELEEMKMKDAEDLRSIYTKTIAEKIANEKQLIAEELRKYAIQTILTTPEKLSVDTINKYLELKSRGLI